MHIELAGAALDLGDLAELGLHGLIDRVGPAAGALDQGAGQAVLFLQQHLEQMFGRKLLVTAGERQGLGRLDRLFSAIGVEIDVHGFPCGRRTGPPP